MSAGVEASASASSLSAFGKARATVPGSPLGPDELRKIDAYLAGVQLPRPRDDLPARRTRC